jgi:Fe-S-cluster containining protein
MQVDRLTWRVRSVRAIFLGWQRWVNGFELTAVDRRHRLFVFACTHYDAVTKRCDSYESRPLMCRDYPVNLTYEAVPPLFDECSHGVVDRHGEALRQALVEAGLGGEKLEAVERRLFLKEAAGKGKPSEPG